MPHSGQFIYCIEKRGSSGAPIICPAHAFDRIAFIQICLVHRNGGYHAFALDQYRICGSPSFWAVVAVILTYYSWAEKLSMAVVRSFHPARPNPSRSSPAEFGRVLVSGGILQFIIHQPWLLGIRSIPTLELRFAQAKVKYRAEALVLQLDAGDELLFRGLCSQLLPWSPPLLSGTHDLRHCFVPPQYFSLEKL